MAVDKRRVSLPPEIVEEGLAAQELGLADSFSSWLVDRIEASRPATEDKIRALTPFFLR